MAKHVYDINFNSCHGSGRRKCNLMAFIRSPDMTLMARNICTCAIFFHFGLPMFFFSQYCWGRALFAVFYGRVLTRAEPFHSGGANVMFKVTHAVLTPCTCVLLIQFALANLKI